MKKLLLFSILSILISQNQNSYCQGVWTQRASIPFTARWGAVGFSVGTMGYVGSGYNNGTNYGDFWQYNPASNTWSQIASIPARRAASAFSIGNYGYVCMGIPPSGNYYTDILEYNPSNNTWTQKATFPGTPRYGASGIAIGTKGYVGCGNEGSASGPFTNEFWEFDPAANAWTQKTNFPGTPRYGLTHMGWAVGNKGYLGFGLDNTMTWPSDFYEYDPTTDTWTQKTNFPLTGRSYGVAFASCGNYYAGCGQNNSIAFSDIWKYDPVTDTWTQKANFGGGNRWLMASFVINGIGYCGTGYDFTNYYNDWWEYTCDNAGTNEQFESENLISFYPTIINDKAELIIKSDKNLDNTFLKVFDINGKLVREENINTKNYSFARKSLQQGVYAYEVLSGSKRIGSGKFIID
ncbi:MAG: T9SS type A sorting domain-containing protein [Bacteroidetes bacterium]|nr:T9SS type A sorting domain-containing protein [Bacteroidota bacterium]